MNPVNDKEGVPHDSGMLEDIELSSAQKTDGFAAIMTRMKSRSAQECAALKVQADEAVLGYEAYALGHEYLERGDFDAAGRWLRVAAGYGIPGAEEALQETAVGQTFDDVVGLTAVIPEPATSMPVPSASGVCITKGIHSGKNDQPWAAALDNLHARQTAAARASATQITEQARREADELLAEAQHRAQAVIDEAQAEAERIREAVHEQAGETAKEEEPMPGGTPPVRHQNRYPLYVSSKWTPVVDTEVQQLQDTLLGSATWSHVRGLLHEGYERAVQEWTATWQCTEYTQMWSAAHALDGVHGVLQTCRFQPAFRIALVPLDQVLGGLPLLVICRSAGDSGTAARSDTAHGPRHEKAFKPSDLLTGSAMAYIVSRSKLHVLGAGSGPRAAAPVGHLGEPDGT